MVVHACHPKYVGSTGRRISIQAGPGKLETLIRKITTAKKVWECGLSRSVLGTIPDPEFKPQIHKKKKVNFNNFNNLTLLSDSVSDMELSEDLCERFFFFFLLFACFLSCIKQF
jgi:hypothetical protein